MHEGRPRLDRACFIIALQPCVGAVTGGRTKRRSNSYCVSAMQSTAALANTGREGAERGSLDQAPGGRKSWGRKAIERERERKRCRLCQPAHNGGGQAARPQHVEGIQIKQGEDVKRSVSCAREKLLRHWGATSTLQTKHG